MRKTIPNGNAEVITTTVYEVKNVKAASCNDNWRLPFDKLSIISANFKISALQSRARNGAKQQTVTASNLGLQTVLNNSNIASILQ